MRNNHDCYQETYDRDRKCKSTTKKPIDINTPVKLEPIVTVGRINTECAKPEISRQSWKKSECNRTCEFVIKQTIYVEIPICYDVDSDIGPSFIDCRDNAPEEEIEC